MFVRRPQKPLPPASILHPLTQKLHWAPWGTAGGSAGRPNSFLLFLWAFLINIFVFSGLVLAHPAQTSKKSEIKIDVSPQILHSASFPLVPTIYLGIFLLFVHFEVYSNLTNFSDEPLMKKRFNGRNVAGREAYPQKNENKPRFLSFSGILDLKHDTIWLRLYWCFYQSQMAEEIPRCYCWFWVFEARLANSHWSLETKKNNAKENIVGCQWFWQNMWG